MTQTNMFEYLYDPVKINKHVRIIELFAGYGSQALALKYLGVDYESYKICEWNYKSCNAYKRIHFGNDNTDYSKDLTKEEIIDYLYGKGISADWNKPMDRLQITRLKEDKLREIYNDIKSTHNLVDISKVKGTDLEIVDKKNNFYIMTYSFPCQDLSLRGKRAGMDKGSETRSSLLWQVDRILHELSEINALPDVLLMENVIQVHSEQNIENFRHWIAQLERLGYQNYWQDLKGTDYGIPQIRNRCFMVSTMNGYYEFPEPVPLNLKLKDLLENNVDEKYFISEKALEFFNKNNEKQAEKGNGYRFEPKTEDEADIAFNINTKAGGRMTDNFIKGKLCDDLIEKAEEGDGIDISSRMEYHRGTVQKGKVQTLNCGGGYGVVVNEPRVIGGFGEKKSNGGTQYYLQDRVYDNEIATTTTTHEQFQPNYVDNQLRIRKLTPKECFRLMGVKDEDSDKLKGMSDMNLYHLAGDSIIVDVLMAIFKKML